MELLFDKTPPGETGVLAEIAPGIRRIVANNGGPFTFTGTCTYVIGRGEVSVIDPGPGDEAHIAALLAGLGNERVAGILITHTHRDHSPGARLLKARTEAPIIGCSAHFAARALAMGEASRLDASSDRDHMPDRILTDGERIEIGDNAFMAIETPGHTMNHLAFALEGHEMLFSGDHVMAWSTSIVAPPDGAMAPYMASLEKLVSREDRAFWPGHGGPVVDPRRFVRGLLSHRRQRETQILDRLVAGPSDIPKLVLANYPGLAPVLFNAAGLSVFAHLEDLVARGLITCEGEPQLDSIYARA